MTVEHPALVAIAVFVAYTVLVGVLWRVTGTRYDHLVDSRSTAVRGIVVPIGAGAVLLALATTWLGWWEDALFPGGRTGPAWALVVPALFALVALLNISTIDFRSPKASILPVLLVGTLLVGFAEELSTRGLLVVGLREGGAQLWVVWLVTSLLFGLLHAMNALFGQSVKTTVMQVIAAFFAGTVLFVTLLTTGSLIVGMILHALWDFGTLGILATDREQKPVAGVLGMLTFLVGIVAVGFVIAAA